MIVPRAISVTEAAIQTGLPTCSIYQLIKEDKIEHFKIGCKHYATVDSLSSYMRGGNPMEDNNLEIPFKNGTATIKKGDIVLMVDDPETSDYMCVLEVAHGGRYGVPHFIFTSEKKPNELTKDDIANIYASCEESWNGFNQIVEDEVMSVPGKAMTFQDRHGNPKTIEDFQRGPWIGIFLMDPRCEGSDLPAGYGIKYTDESTRLALQKKIFG